MDRIYVWMQRRNFIRAAGIASTSSIGIIGVGAASEGRSEKLTGVDHAIAKLLREAEFDKAKKIADRHGLDYTMSKDVVNNSGDDVGTDSFARDESTLYLSVVERSGGDDLWLASATAVLTGNHNTLVQEGTHVVEDGFGIFFDSSEWTAPDPDPATVNRSISWDGPIVPGDDGYSVGIADYDPNYGVAAEVELPEQWAADDTSELVVGLQEDFTRVDTGNDNVAIQSRYNHTYGNSSTLSSVSIGIGPIGFSVDVSYGDDLWDPLYVTAKPGESDES